MKKVPTDGGTGVYVYARPTMDVFAHHSGDEGELLLPEEMSHSVHDEGLEPWIGEYDLVHALGRGDRLQRRLRRLP